MTQTIEELAKEAYEVYGKAVNFRNYRGELMPLWETLPENIKNAWIAVCKHLVLKYTI